VESDVREVEDMPRKDLEEDRSCEGCQDDCVAPPEITKEGKWSA
jgi:hypothetical protein